MAICADILRRIGIASNSSGMAANIIAEIRWIYCIPQALKPRNDQSYGKLRNPEKSPIGINTFVIKYWWKQPVQLEQKKGS